VLALLVCMESIPFFKGHQENVGAWSKVVLNAPGPPRGVVVPWSTWSTPIHSDPYFL